ncbi:MAG: hypothetical protein J6S57_01425 [Alphaproteobacteria bacterium]|nr:hypothetical protein [Alphaproteobacteria bacterium]
MKNFLTVLTSLLVLPAFAEVAPVYYDDVVEYTDKMIESADNTSGTQSVVQRPAANRTVARTGAPRTSAGVRNAQRTTVATNRSTVSRAAASGVSARSNATRTTTARSGVTTRARQSDSSSPAVRARAGTGFNTVMPGVKVSESGTVTKLEDSGESLYNDTAESRVGMRAGKQLQRRASTMRIATAAPAVETDIETATANLSDLAELTNYCKAQYAACMDNYCNVLDDNQGRCSCSKNIKNYEKVENALSQATYDFQDVIQKIKYIGLTADQVASLFEETEAELVMSSTKDQSKLTSSLEQIRRKIVDASSSSSSSYVTGNSLAIDVSGLLNFDLSAAFDLSAFLNSGSKTNTTSVSNQRGEQLYKSASTRCKTAILDSCTNQGVEANVVVNAYDLEIDKQCVLYERNLNDANAEMKDNVRNAGIILQQARLLLAQNKNAYDFRGCVAALDSCMQDEYVCGADYELCLDPTGKYIANGEIVKGGTPGVSGGTNVNSEWLINNNEQMKTWHSGGMYGLYSTWNYGAAPTAPVTTGNNPSWSPAYNAWGSGQMETLGNYVDENITNWSKNYAKQGNLSQESMARFLLQKIGYIDVDGKAHGMCAGIMKQCQDFTYAATGKSKTKVFLFDNSVIRQYLQTTLMRIKAEQDEILAEYASDCQNDVTSCLSSNGFEEDTPNSYASSLAVNACRTEIQTCMSVSGQQPADNTDFDFRAMRDWVRLLLVNCPANYYLAEYTEDGLEKTGCRSCPIINGRQTVSAGGNVLKCTCPGDYADVTNDRGELVACSPTSCAANQYLKLNVAYVSGSETVDYYYHTCEACPDGATSAGGDATQCTCPTNKHWEMNSNGFGGSCESD